MSKIKRCPICKRSKNEAIKEQLSQFSNCGVDGCVFASEINEAINKKFNDMICPKCNKQNEANATHCIHCNALLKKTVKTKEDKVHIIFISHAEKDKKIVGCFKEMLNLVLCTQSFKYEFFCSSEAGSIGSGLDNHKVIHENLNATNNVLCFLTTNSFNRPWIMYEIGYAKGKSSKKKVMFIAKNIDIKKIKEYPYSRYSIYPCEEVHIFKLIMELLKNINPSGYAGKEDDLKKSFAPHIKEFIDKIPKNRKNGRNKKVSDLQTK
jgi:ribosomal protein L40E